jgi:hypothetical protein
MSGLVLASVTAILYLFWVTLYWIGMEIQQIRKHLTKTK